jgi:hypothetical protein
MHPAHQPLGYAFSMIAPGTPAAFRMFIALFACFCQEYRASSSARNHRFYFHDHLEHPFC